MTNVKLLRVLKDRVFKLFTRKVLLFKIAVMYRPMVNVGINCCVSIHYP